MSFHVGQRVVCVNDEWQDWWPHYEYWWPHKPIKGHIYTIRAVRYDPIRKGDGVLLYEIHNPERLWGDGNTGEGGFMAYKFRPLTERKTDISVFKRILADASKEKEAAE